ncbi:hypothetical protein [Flammeovirga aprica]|uniref:Uncharacterized protein n=1 Tax=Flammeovirga aprica JL-4 TaxID=694437 RepID=A0A7X9XCC5_9BACT|nr:hypothetical protein [Flammeovirga aprica]NME71666.1 hypothetical protein [Flammeovirga aprica JL-4]
MKVKEHLIFLSDLDYTELESEHEEEEVEKDEEGGDGSGLAGETLQTFFNESEDIKKEHYLRWLDCFGGNEYSASSFYRKGNYLGSISTNRFGAVHSSMGISEDEDQRLIRVYVNLVTTYEYLVSDTQLLEVQIVLLVNYENKAEMELAPVYSFKDFQGNTLQP